MKSFTIGAFHERLSKHQRWTALLPSHHRIVAVGQSEGRLRDQLTARLRTALKNASPEEQTLFVWHPGVRLVHLFADVGARSASGTFRLSGEFPLVCEPRWINQEEERLFLWHPFHPEHWFTARTSDEAATLFPSFARHTWGILGLDAIEEMRSTKKERLTQLSFSAEVPTLLDAIDTARRVRRERAGLRRPSQRVLPTLGVDQTLRAVDGTLPLGAPREPLRARLSQLASGADAHSLLLLGPAGAGKTTLLNRLVADLLELEGYPLHHNLDRVRHIWRVSGKRLIAGMSYMGDWEERCTRLFADALRHKAVLWIEDLHLFGRLGQSRQSERSLADAFRAPLERRELRIWATATREQLRRLEDDAPSLAAQLFRVPVPAATALETRRLTRAVVRSLERRLPVAIHPEVPPLVLDLSHALFPWTARPGSALSLLTRVAERASSSHPPPEAGQPTTQPIRATDVLETLARETGLPPLLLSSDSVLDPSDVEATFSRRVLGQPEATRAAAELVLSLRAGLSDPQRPLGVLLFTGPTGTGKTELATALAEYLYGDTRRLVRIDMSELSGPDGVARLIGDRWEPHGQLTERVHEQPFCVVLLDEIEKAHPSVLSLLLQLLDEGRLTDAKGDTVSFAGAAIVMTSNLGASALTSVGFGANQADGQSRDVQRAVEAFFPPELFNRIDRVVPFSALSETVAEAVVEKELQKLLTRRGLRERNVFVSTRDSLRARVVKEAFDPRFGARTVKRWLEHEVGTSLSEAIARATPARLRLIELYDAGGRVALHEEALEERALPAGRSALQDALFLPLAKLDTHIAASVDALRRLQERLTASPRWKGDLAYFQEQLKAHLQSAVEVLAPDDSPDDDEEEAEDDYLPSQHRGRMRRTRQRRAPTRDAVLGAMAEVGWFSRWMDDSEAPLQRVSAHAATALLSTVGPRSHSTAAGLRAVASLYIDGPNLESAAIRLTSGELCVFEAPIDIEALLSSAAKARRIALTLRGLAVGARLRDEHGTHVLQSEAEEPVLVRVEIGTDASGTARDALLERERACDVFERALDQGGTPPPNPDSILPVVRQLMYRAPLRPGEPWHFDIDDRLSGYVGLLSADGIVSAVRQLRWLSGSVR